MLDRNTAAQGAPLTRGSFFALRSPLIASLLVVVMCAIPFVVGLPGPFLLDDWGNLEPLLNVDASATSVYGSAFNNGSGFLLRPVSNLSFIANLLLAGPYPLPFKLTNLAIHVTNGVLVFFVAQALLRVLAPAATTRRQQLTALAASAIWTVHPLQVSTVLYVVQRMTMLATLFSLLALLIAFRFLDSARAPTRLRWLKALAVFLLATGLAVLSKENGALVPLMLLATYVAAPQDSRARLTDSHGKIRFWLTGVVALLALGAVCLALGWERLVAYGGRPFTLIDRLLTEPFVLLGYLRSIFIPMPSRMGLFLDDTVLRTAADPLAWIGLAGVAAAVAGALLVRRQFPVLAFAALWFLACHALESTVFPLELAFEHRNYLALLGPALAVAQGPAWLGARYGTRIAATAAIILVTGLGLATFQRARQWGSEESFALTEARNHPDSIRAQNLAGIVERRRGNTASPIARMARMKKVHPEQFFPFAMDMDFACDATGHPVDWAGIHRTAALDIGGSEVQGYFNHITLAVASGRCQGIAWRQLDVHLIRLVTEASNRNATRAAQYYTVLRASLREKIDPTEAGELFYQAAALDPASTELWQRIAMFEISQNNRSKALEAIRRADATLTRWSPTARNLDQLRLGAKSLPMR